MTILTGTVPTVKMTVFFIDFQNTSSCTNRE